MSGLDELSLEEIEANFELLGDWEQRFSYLLDLGRKLPSLPDDARTEENRVRGCQSTVWLKAAIEEGDGPTIVLVADSDAHMVKGLIAILLVMYSGRSPDEILAVDAEGVFARLGLDTHLSPTRRNGLFSMVERIRALAAQHAGVSP